MLRTHWNVSNYTTWTCPVWTLLSCSRAYTQLENLEMHNCKVPSLPDFSFAHKLKHINLNYNKITSYPPTPGFPTDNVLETLHISGNRADNLLDSISGFFEGLPRLTRLGMNNVGTSVWPNVSSYIGTLRMLHVGGNPLNGIDYERFIGVNNVTSPELPPGGYPNLVDLDVHGIMLTYFPEELFSIFPRLTHLRMAYNQFYLTNVPNFTLAHSTLHVIDIRYNGQGLNSPYPTFNYETVFHDMRNLRYLYMKQNLIERFPFSPDFIINQFPVLRFIGLQDNLMQIIPDLTSVGNTAHHGDLQVTFGILSQYRPDTLNSQTVNSKLPFNLKFLKLFFATLLSCYV